MFSPKKRRLLVHFKLHRRRRWRRIRKWRRVRKIKAIRRQFILKRRYNPFVRPKLKHRFRLKKFRRTKRSVIRLIFPRLLKTVGKNKVIYDHFYYLHTHRKIWGARGQLSSRNLIDFRRPKPPTRRRKKFLSFLRQFAFLLTIGQMQILWPYFIRLLPTVVASKLWSSSRIPLEPDIFRHRVKTPDLAFFWSTLLTFTRTAKPDLATPVTPLTNSFYLKYLTHFAESLTQEQVLFSFLPYRVNNEELAPIIQATIACIYPKFRTFHPVLAIDEFQYLISVALHQKNASLLLRWFVRFMQLIPPRLHRKFLFFLRLFFVKLFTTKPESYDYKGFKLVLRGKISVTGNAKKRTQRISTGICSLSTKNHAISYSRGIIHTPTGVLGVKIFIFY